MPEDRLLAGFFRHRCAESANKKPAQWRAFRVRLGNSTVQFDALITLRALGCIGCLITIHNTSSAQGSVVSETMNVKQR